MIIIYNYFYVYFTFTSHFHHMMDRIKGLPQFSFPFVTFLLLGVVYKLRNVRNKSGVTAQKCIKENNNDLEVICRRLFDTMF